MKDRLKVDFKIGFMSKKSVNFLSVARRKSTSRRLNEGLSQIKENELTIWEESLPRVCTSKPFTERLYGEMAQNHKWFGVFFQYS